MTYGLPYKGSKTKLAERIIDLMPRAEHLYDLFAGGCAIAHCALIKGKYGHVHINDINPMMPQAFVKALNGGFDDEDRWISREDFFRLKDTDPYAALCFSFGSDTRTYIYGKDKEEYKKALHYAIYFNSFDLSDKIIGVDLRPIQSCRTRQERYLMAKRLIRTPRQDASSGRLYRKYPPPQLENHGRLRRVQAAKLRATHTALSSKKKKNRLGEPRTPRQNACPPPFLLIH